MIDGTGFGDHEPTLLAGDDVVSRFSATFGQSEHSAIEMIAWLQDEFELPRNGEYLEIARRFRDEEMKTIAFAMSHENPAAALAYIALAKGYGALIDYRNASELGIHLNVTRANVTKYQIQVQKRFGIGMAGIPQMPGQKSDITRRKLSESRKRQLVMAN